MSDNTQNINITKKGKRGVERVTAMPKLLVSIRFSKKDKILQFSVISLFAHSVRVTVRAVKCRVTDIVTAPYATYAILRGSFFFTHTRNVYLSIANPSKIQKNLMTRHFQTMVITGIFEQSQPSPDSYKWCCSFDRVYRTVYCKYSWKGER